jgi:TrpR-related protein YerC/YecD
MNWNSPEKKRFIEAILALEKPDEATRFLRDLMTEREILDFAKRFETAELLSQKVSYSEIEKKTGFSSTTVARVSKWLNSGEGGYKAIISKLHHHTNSL